MNFPTRRIRQALTEINGARRRMIFAAKSQNDLGSVRRNVAAAQKRLDVAQSLLASVTDDFEIEDDVVNDLGPNYHEEEAV